MPVITVDGVLYVPRINMQYKGNAKSLGAALKECRQNCNMSLDKASDMAGIAKSYLWSLEKNESEPSLWIAGSLARLYGIDLRTLAEMPRA